MNKSDARRAIAEAKFNEDAGGFLSLEILFISISLGFMTQSWWAFGGALLGTFTLLAISKTLANIICLALSLCWGALGYAIGMLFSSLNASIVLAIIAFVMAWGTHRAAMTHYNDIYSNE